MPNGAESSAKYSSEANSIFAFLKQTFFKMPRSVQVFGWLIFLLLFVFLVLYPLIGISYFQGKVMKVDQDEAGLRIKPRVPRLKVHHTTATTLTNDEGEFTIAIRGPILPMAKIDLDFGESNYVENVTLPAPFPLLSLFNPNPTKIYYVPRAKTEHYFLDEEQADKAFEEAIQALIGNSSAVQDAGLKNDFFTPFVVQAQGVPPGPGFVMRIGQLTLKNAEIANAYFDIRVNDRSVHIDSVPDENSPSSRMVSIQAGKPIRIENFDIPLGQGPVGVQINLRSKSFLFFKHEITSGTIAFVPPKPQEIGQQRTIQQGNLEITYEILSPVALACAGVNSNKEKGLLILAVWLDTPPAFLESVSGVQYDLGPAFNSQLVSFPAITKASYWMYRISAYSPQVIRGKVSFLGGDSISVSTLCNVGSASKTAIGYSALATAYNADDQFVLAVQSADKALQIDPGLEIAIEIKASALGQMGQFSAAIEQYRRAISLGNAGPDILNGYAWFLADRLPNPTRVQLTEAKRMAEEAIKGEPNGYNWDTLGWTDYKLGDYVGALAALETSKSLLLRDDSDTSSSAWQELNYHLGNTLIRFKNKQTEALQAFMEVTEYDKKYPSSSNKDYVKAANDQIPKLKASFPSESPVPGRPTRRLSRP